MSPPSGPRDRRIPRTAAFVGDAFDAPAAAASKKAAGIILYSSIDQQSPTIFLKIMD
jgi:hypothetical protein